MTDGDGDEQDHAPPARGVPRRALLGGALTAAAAGIVGYEVGSANASPADEGSGAAPAEASAVAVTPKGELVADDVQAALVDVYDRTSALARLEDLRVAYELVDDFPPGAGRVGALGWTPVATGAGAAVEQAPLEGGVVRLVTGSSPSGRAGVHLGLEEHTGAPVFTMQWRLRLEARPDPDQRGVVAFGALSSLTADLTGAGLGPALVWVHDPAIGPNWICRAIQGGEVVDVDSKRAVTDVVHRFTITSDGDGLARFDFDDGEVASLATDPKEVGRYGQGAVVAKASGSTPMAVAVDWFYLRRELPR